VAEGGIFFLVIRSIAKAATAPTATMSTRIITHTSPNVGPWACRTFTIALADLAVYPSASVTLRYISYVPLLVGVKVQLLEVAPDMAVPFTYHW
jgi:hypothetical protein